MWQFCAVPIILNVGTAVFVSELNLVTLVGEDICQHGEHDAKPDGECPMLDFGS